MGEKEKSEPAARVNIAPELHFLIDDELRLALQERARAEGVKQRKLSRFCRTLLRAGLAGGWLDGMDKTLTELKALRSELSRIGGNLNQVAHWINSRDELKEKDLLEAIKELRPAFNACTDLAKELHHGLIRRTR